METSEPEPIRGGLRLRQSLAQNTGKGAGDEGEARREEVSFSVAGARRMNVMHCAQCAPLFEPPAGEGRIIPGVPTLSVTSVGNMRSSCR
jgi:hypothetical protein